MKKLFILIAIIAIATTAKSQDVITVNPGNSVTVKTAPCDQVAQQPVKTKTNALPKKKHYFGGIPNNAPYFSPSKITVTEVGQLADIFADYQNRTTAYRTNYFQQISMEQKNYGSAIIYPEGMAVFYGKVPDAAKSQNIPSAASDDSSKNGLMILGFLVVIFLLAYLVHQNNRNTAHGTPTDTPVTPPPAPTVPSHESLKPGDTLEAFAGGGYRVTKGIVTEKTKTEN